MDYPKLFADIHLRPGLSGLDGSYHDYCTFVRGVDIGNDRNLLAGFREMLVPRVGGGDNLTWDGLVLHLAFPDRTGGWREEAAGPGREAANDQLFALLAEFFEKRASCCGLAEIYSGYLAWRKAQSWHRG